jgi:hypothetical protein
MIDPELLNEKGQRLFELPFFLFYRVINRIKEALPKVHPKVYPDAFFKKKGVTFYS